MMAARRILGMRAKPNSGATLPGRLCMECMAGYGAVSITK